MSGFCSRRLIYNVQQPADTIQDDLLSDVELHGCLTFSEAWYTAAARYFNSMKHVDKRMRVII